MIGWIKNFFQQKKPLISVIIANYNNERFLKECIVSVLNQTYENFELIICDDFSTDSSKMILDQYLLNHNNIKVIYNKNNLGISKTRHQAIIESSGKYITTLDSDDYYIDNDKLKKEMELISNYEKQGKKIIAFSNVDVVDIEGKKILSYQGNNIKEGNLLNQLLSRECMIPRDYMLLKKSYFEVGGFDLNINLHEDWDLKIRLANKYEYYYTNIMAIAYRRKGYGLSCTSSENRIISIRNVFDKNIDLITDDIDMKACKNKIENYLLQIKD